MATGHIARVNGCSGIDRPRNPSRKWPGRVNYVYAFSTLAPVSCEDRGVAEPCPFQTTFCDLRMFAGLPDQNIVRLVADLCRFDNWTTTAAVGRLLLLIWGPTVKRSSGCQRSHMKYCSHCTMIFVEIHTACETYHSGLPPGIM